MKNTKKNIIPVIAVLVLIVIIILFMLLGRLIEKYTPSKENKLLYTTATDLISADAESTTYYVTKDARTLDHTIVKADASTAYIAIDFVKQYSDFDYTVYDQPNRVVLTNQWGDYNTAPVKKSTELRYQGGIRAAASAAASV